MTHGLTDKDTMFSVRKMPWHGLGALLEDHPRSIEDALENSGLGWGVRTAPVMIERRPAWTDDFGRDYEPLDNHEAFRFLDELIGTQLHFETAGSLWGGRRVWVLARLPEWVEVGGDQTATYVYIANAHDGSMAVTAAVTPVRIVCANTLGYALRRSEGQGAQRTFRHRHTGGLHTRLHEARRVMQITVHYAKQFKALGDRLALEPISEQALRARILDELFAAPDAAGERTDRNREQAKAAVMAMFLGQATDGDTRGQAPGTKWCAVNAIAEWADHGRRYTKRTTRCSAASRTPRSSSAGSSW